MVDPTAPDLRLAAKLMPSLPWDRPRKGDIYASRCGLEFEVLSVSGDRATVVGPSRRKKVVSVVELCRMRRV